MVWHELFGQSGAMVWHELANNDDATKPPGCHGTELKMIQMSIHDDVTFLNVLAYIYGLVPFVTGALAGIFFCVIAIMVMCKHASSGCKVVWKELQRDAVEVLCWVVCVMGLVPIVCAVVKKIMDEPRPYGTCVTSKGMPSGHSGNATANLVWIPLWTWVGGGRYRFGPVGKIVITVLAIFIFVPVPWSRMHLHDHSGWQCFVGGIIGVACTSTWMLLWPYSWKASWSLFNSYVRLSSEQQVLFQKNVKKNASDVETGIVNTDEYQALVAGTHSDSL